MLKKLLATVAVGLACVGSAMASPVPVLPGGPLYFQFNNREQIAIAGSTGAAFGDSLEINWGVLTVSSIAPGVVTGPNTIAASGAAFFNNISSGGQVTGIFYGIHAHAGNAQSPFPASGGFLDLWYRDLSSMTTTDLATTSPTGLRTGYSTATGYTQGTQLAHIAFASGINTLDGTITINGDTTLSAPPPTTFLGSAASYGNIADVGPVNGITAADGAWATALNTDFFSTIFGTRDFTFRNVYQELASWDDCGPSNAFGCFVGARSSDPATSVAIPEPGTLALLGLSLLGLAGLRRKQSA